MRWFVSRLEARGSVLEKRAQVDDHQAPVGNAQCRRHAARHDPLADPAGRHTGDSPEPRYGRLGGPIVTASGLVFIAASLDNRLRAFDTSSGKLLWEVKLPAGGQATAHDLLSGGSPVSRDRRRRPQERQHRWGLSDRLRPAAIERRRDLLPTCPYPPLPRGYGHSPSRPRRSSLGGE